MRQNIQDEIVNNGGVAVDAALADSQKVIKKGANTMAQ